MKKVLHSFSIVLIFIIFSTITLIANGTNNCGKIIVSADEWPTTDQGYINAASGSTNNFVKNVANYFTNGNPGKFLIASTNFAYANSFRYSLTSGGHTYVYNPGATNYADYDGIFIGGQAYNITLLTQYVNNGGCVYVVGGTGYSNEQGTLLNPFLNQFGLQFQGYPGTAQWLISNLNHPIIFNGVTNLYTWNPNIMMSIIGNYPYSKIISSQNGYNWWAVYEEPCDPPLDNMVLWYDASDATKITTIPGDYVTSWIDKTTPSEVAMPLDANMRPKLDAAAFPSAPIANNKRGVAFEIKYGASEYGLSDILTTADIDGECVSQYSDIWNPNSKDKSLFIIFKTGNNIDKLDPQADPDPYYSDGRQCIFEAGGPLSGYNAYIINGKFCFGMWNRFERKFMVYNPPPGESYIYPLSPTTVYLAVIEYDNINKQFRVGVSIYNDGPLAPPYNSTFSGYIPFHGLTLDPDYSNELIAIGGASRTAYADFNIGATHSDHFAGTIGEILLYNKFYSRITGGNYNYTNQYFLYNLYGYINSKFGTKFEYQQEFHTVPKISYWDLIDNSVNTEKTQLSTAYPNPFDNKSSFSVYLPEAKSIRVELFNSMGQKVSNIFSGSLSGGVHDFVIDGAGLADGMYIFRITGDGFVLSGKVVLSR